MGTNFYIRKKVPTIHETVHICKRSWGWRTSWQKTEAYEWPRWCDEDRVIDDYGYSTGPNLPHDIRRVSDIVDYLKTGEWELIDEYGMVYDDWEEEIKGLVEWNGGEHEDRDFVPFDHVEECGGGYHDEHGNVFLDVGFE